MKKTIILVGLIIAASINIFGQTNNNSTQTDNDKKEVIALASELNKAKINFFADASVLERIIADDYKETSLLDGEITKSRLIGMGKEWSKKLPSSGERLVSYTSTETQVRFYGDTAILTEAQEWVIKNYPDGKNSIDGGEFFMVAIKRNGRWGIVFWGDTPDPNYTLQKPKPQKPVHQKNQRSVHPNNNGGRTKDN